MILEYWTNAKLTNFEAELDRLGTPEWSRELYHSNRRHFHPTYAEARKDIRDLVHDGVVKPLRRLNDPDCPPNWLTPSGIEWMHKHLMEKRKEHSSLIRLERESVS